jgi:hypothetical protein
MRRSMLHLFVFDAILKANGPAVFFHREVRRKAVFSYSAFLIPDK